MYMTVQYMYMHMMEFVPGDRVTCMGIPRAREPVRYGHVGTWAVARAHIHDVGRNARYARYESEVSERTDRAPALLGSAERLT